MSAMEKKNIQSMPMKYKLLGEKGTQLNFYVGKVSLRGFPLSKWKWENQMWIISEKHWGKFSKHIHGMASWGGKINEWEMSLFGMVCMTRSILLLILINRCTQSILSRKWHDHLNFHLTIGKEKGTFQITRHEVLIGELHH